MPSTLDGNQVLQSLADLIAQSSGSFSSGARATEGETSESDRTARANQVRYNAATKDLKTASKEFTKLAKDQNKTTDEIKRQVDLNSHFISTAIESVSKLNIDSSVFDGLEDLFKSEEQLKIATEMKEVVDGMKTNTVFDNAQYDALVTRLGDVGLTVEDLGMVVHEHADEAGNLTRKIVGQRDATENLTDFIDDLSESVKDTASEMQKLADRAEMFEKGVKGLAAGVAVTAKLAIDETRMAMRTATGDATTIAGAFTAIHKLRITTQEYQEILARTRTVQHAVNQSGANYNNVLTTAASSLFEFSGSSKEAADSAAAMIDNVTMMGMRFKDLDKPMERQKALYAKHFRGMSMSLGAFNELTADLLADTDVRNDLARLDKKQRQAYIEGLQITTADNIQKGYSIERAKELNKHFAKISGMNPLERLKKAAKERAMMGTLGMAAEGAELQKILTNLPSMQEGEAKSKAQARATEIRAQAANELKRRRGQSVGADVTYGMLSEKLGYGEIANMFQNEALEGRKFDKEVANEANGHRIEANKYLQKGVLIADEVRAATFSSHTAMAAMAAAWVMSGAMGKSMDLLNATAGKTLLATMSGGAGGMLAKTGLVGLVAASVGSLAELAISGGARSTVHDLVSTAMPDFTEKLGEVLATTFGDAKSQDEIARLQKRADDNAAAQLEAAKLRQETKEANREKLAYAKQTAESLEKIARKSAYSGDEGVSPDNY